MSTKISWGILGTGGIAKMMAGALQASSTSTLCAVGSRSQQKAQQFGEAFAVARCYGSYEALLADPDVQVVYLALPNHLHAEWGIRCARAGKHLLCEKPLASNFAEADALVAAVRTADVFLMEAFMYRCHPQTARIVELVKSGIIGEVRLIQANFSFNFGEQPENIRSQAATAGGGIMDVGSYTMSLTRLVAGAALGLDGPAEPLAVTGVAHLDPVGQVDTWTTASVKFPGEILAALTCGMQVSVPAPTTIYGTRGRIEVQNPWFPGETAESATITLYRDGADTAEIYPTPGTAGLYTLEVDTVARYLPLRQAPAPAMTWADSLGNARALDLWRHSVGVMFPGE